MLKFFFLLGVIHSIVYIDCEKRSESESAAFDFSVKKVSAYGIDKDILKKIHKFLFPFQQLIVKDVHAIINRLEKEKGVPSLTSHDCLCMFCNRYLLPCKHIFHEYMHRNKLLIANVWRIFQEMFEESEFEVFESRELFIEYVQT